MKYLHIGTQTLHTHYTGVGIRLFKPTKQQINLGKTKYTRSPPFSPPHRRFFLVF